MVSAVLQRAIHARKAAPLTLLRYAKLSLSRKREREKKRAGNAGPFHQ
jgi:hypothetical protein